MLGRRQFHRPSRAFAMQELTVAANLFSSTGLSIASGPIMTEDALSTNGKSICWSSAASFNAASAARKKLSGMVLQSLFAPGD